MAEPRPSTDEESAPLLTGNGHAEDQGGDHSFFAGLTAVAEEPLTLLSKILIAVCLLLLLLASVFVGLFAGAEHRLKNPPPTPSVTTTVYATLTATATATATTTTTTTYVSHAPTPTPPPLPCLTPECINLSSSILASLDTSVDPCDDFYQFASGGWLKENPLPAAKASFGTFNQLAQKNVQVIRDIIEREPPRNTSSSDALSLKKIHNLYQSCMDEETLDNLGQEPLLEFTRAVRSVLHGNIAAKEVVGSEQRVFGAAESNTITRVGLTAAISLLHSRGVPVLFWFDIDGDAGVDPDFMTLGFRQEGLGLPAKEYYGEQSVVDAYQASVTRILLALDETADDATAPVQHKKFWPPHWPPWGGGDEPDKENKTARAKRLAKEVIEFEKKLAKASLDLDLLFGDPFGTYNPTPFENFTKALPEVDIAEYVASFTPRNFPEKIIVTYPPYVRSLSRLISETHADTMEAYFVSQAAFAHAPYLGLSTEVWKAKRELDEVLRGLKKGAIDDRDEFCLQRVESALGFAAGRFFVQETFGGDSQIKAAKVIDDIITTFKASLPNLVWMDEESAAAASQKATAIRVKVGYPFSPNTTDDRSIARYYYLVKPSPKTFFENMVSASVSDEFRRWSTLGKIRDRGTWEMFPSTVNAYFNPPANEIVFPAGILRPPFFSQEWPAYLAYGAFGSVAAHELTHAFDSAGRMYNQRGKLEVWWTNKTSEQFDERKNCIAQQYSSYTVEDGKGGVVHVNGNLTSGENIGDAGLIYAYHAWQNLESGSSFDGSEFILPGLDKYTKEQLFFIAYGRIWARNMKPAAAVAQVRTDPHSPARYRVRGTLSNIPAFAEAFNCPIGSPMNPRKKCSLWA